MINKQNKMAGNRPPAIPHDRVCLSDAAARHRGRSGFGREEGGPVAASTSGPGPTPKECVRYIQGVHLLDTRNGEQAGGRNPPVASARVLCQTTLYWSLSRRRTMSHAGPGIPALVRLFLDNDSGPRKEAGGAL
jgi:hypothetical protein